MTDQPITIGTRVHCVLRYLGRGTVFRIEDGQRSEVSRPSGVRTVRSAQFAVVFDNGSISEHIGESILRGVQWTILSETASSEQIAHALASAYCARAAAQVAADIEEARVAAEVERLRSDPAFAKLEQGDDEHGGKLAARNLRVELKAAFSGVKFTVRKSDHGSINIGWIDGPTAAQVKAIAGKYSGGSFDGMDDSYGYVSTPWTKVFGSAKYIFDNRDFSDELIEEAIALVFDRYAGNFAGSGIRATAEDYRRGALWTVSIPMLGEPLDVTIRIAASSIAR